MDTVRVDAATAQGRVPGASERDGAGPPAAPGEHRGLSDSVHEALLELLMSRGVEPGSALRTQAVADRLGVSATPVREALARLEATGLVVRSARRGYRAAPLLTPEELGQLVDVRLLVEPGNAERACRRSDDAFVRRLWGAVEAQRTAPTGPGYAGFKEYLRADWSFHELVAEGTGNPFIVRTLDSFRGFVQRLHQVEERVPDAADSVAEHEAIVRAFEQRDPAGAADAMRRHLERVLRRAAPG
ncbi:FCD domain-containing protein [Kineococcus sp. R8]|uniref:GntR family transcriptional regulator n=1 Tax=Kineococcus siccus TaxID=2696567 RepID=UPI0014124181|nr:GntR family transcriptional regulator [Kineococcus siccus]NAZ82002.1 FCD domain-containing protein [Kineococcus siccus]